MHEDIFIRHVIGDRGEELDVGAEAHHAGGKIGRRPYAFHVVALQVVCDRGRPAIPAREHGGTASVGLEEDRRRAIERARLNRAHCPGSLLGICAKIRRGTGERCGWELRWGAVSRWRWRPEIVNGTHMTMRS